MAQAYDVSKYLEKREGGVPGSDSMLPTPERAEYALPPSQPLPSAVGKRTWSPGTASGMATAGCRYQPTADRRGHRSRCSQKDKLVAAQSAPAGLQVLQIKV